MADGKWNKDTEHTLYAQWGVNSEENKEMAKFAVICLLEPLILVGALVLIIRRR